MDQSSWTQSQRVAFDGIIATYRKSVLDIQRSPVFVSGGGGTGKSFLLRKLCEYFREISAKTLVTATQAIAAQLVDGRTVHSAFQLRRVRRHDGTRFVSDIESFNYDVLIIDEVSMLSDTLMDTIESKLCQLKQCSAPFGGVFVVCFGDLLQLAPVQDNAVYMSKAWKYFKLVALTCSVRHREDRKYDNLMSRLRIGDPSVVLEINEECVRTSDEIDRELLANDTTVVVAKNSYAEKCNVEVAKRLIRESNSSYVVLTRTDCDVHDPQQTNEDSILYTKAEVERIVPKDVAVFAGATLIFTANGLSNGPWCNGDLCKVQRVDSNDGTGVVNGVTVKLCKTNRVVTVTPQSFRYSLRTDDDDDEFARYKKRCVVGFPLAYGWSVTIHKVQGSTYDRLVVNPSEIFCSGQLYVALSRVRSCAGLLLTHAIDINKVMCSKQTMNVYAKMKRLVTDGTVCDSPSCMGDVYKRLYEECMRRMTVLQEQLTNMNLELVTVCAENEAALLNK